MSGAKKPTRDGPDIFPFRVLYSPTPDITGIFSQASRKRWRKKTHGCRVRRTALVGSFLGSNERLGGLLEWVKRIENKMHIVWEKSIHFLEEIETFENIVVYICGWWYCHVRAGEVGCGK